MRLLVFLSVATLAWSFVNTPVNRFQPASRLTSGLGERKDHLSHISVLSSKNGNDDKVLSPVARANAALLQLKQKVPDLLKASSVALMLFLATFGNMDAASAASSGRRIGGSGFRSGGSSTRQYATPPSRSYSSPSPRYYSSPSIVPVIPYSPFGFGFGFPFGGFGGGMYRVGYGISPIDVIILGGLAVGAYNFLKNRVSGASWDYDGEEPSSLGSGVTVLKLQVGLSVADRSSLESILGQLDTIAANADTSDRQGLANVVSQSCLALLRCSKDWISAAGESKAYGSGEKKAESEYNRLAVRERSKFEKEVSKEGGRSSYNSPYFTDSRPTLAVVTLCVAIRGSSTKIGKVSSVTGLRQALQMLAGDALSDDGENVLAAELLWTPQDNGDVLTKREIVEDYPELMDL